MREVLTIYYLFLNKTRKWFLVWVFRQQWWGRSLLFTIFTIRWSSGHVRLDLGDACSINEYMYGQVKKESSFSSGFFESGDEGGPYYIYYFSNFCFWSSGHFSGSMKWCMLLINMCILIVLLVINIKSTWLAMNFNSFKHFYMDVGIYSILSRSSQNLFLLGHKNRMQSSWASFPLPTPTPPPPPPNKKK